MAGFGKGRAHKFLKLIDFGGEHITILLQHKQHNTLCVLNRHAGPVEQLPLKKTQSILIIYSLGIPEFPTLPP